MKTCLRSAPLSFAQVVHWTWSAEYRMGQPDFATIERPELIKDRVCRILENAILSGQIGKNEILTESALAEKLKVSRTPVREALQELTAKGLLEPAGVRSKRVRHLGLHEAREIFWLRGVLEGAIAERLAVNGITKDQAEEAERHLENQRAAVRARDLLAFLSGDSGFHIALAGFLGFPRVSGIVANLRELYNLLGIKTMTAPSRYEEILAEHARILKAIRSGSATEARKAVSDHLLRTEETIILALDRAIG